MPRYLIERTYTVDQEQLPVVGRRSRELAEQHFPEIVWEHSHVCLDDAGVVKSYCVYDAPSVEIVRQHAKMLGEHHIETVLEIAGDVTPDDFPPLED